MLIKILDLVAGTDLDAGKLLASINFYDDADTTKVADISAYANKDYFLVKNLTTPNTITPDSVVAKELDNSTLIIKFANTALAVGEILSIGAGITIVPETGLKTASILYQLAGTNTDSTSANVVAPKSGTTSESQYNITLNMFDVNGEKKSSQTFTIDAPFMVAGEVVTTIELTGNFTSTFAAGDVVPFTAKYKNAAGDYLVVSTGDLITFSVFTKKA